MKRKNHTNKNGDYSMAHVLYQKLGNDWYAFTEMDGDCFMTKVNAEEAENHFSTPAERNEQKQSRKRKAA